jgi:hypothetical protein
MATFKTGVAVATGAAGFCGPRNCQMTAATMTARMTNAIVIFCEVFILV